MERIIRFLIQEISSLEGCQLIKNKAALKSRPVDLLSTGKRV